MTGMKLQNLKLTDHTAEYEIAGHEISGLILPEMKM